MWRVLLSFGLVAAINGSPQEFELLHNSKKTLNFKDFTIRSSSASFSCNVQLSQLQESVQGRDLWARKMRDSWGDVPSGVYSGNAYDFGNYDQCIDIDENTRSGQVIGQHCLLSIPFDRFGQPKSEKMGTAFKTSKFRINVGVCVPESCSKQDVADIFNKTLQEDFDSKLKSISCSTRNQNSHLQGSKMNIFSICFFGFFAILVISSTIYDICGEYLQSKQNLVLKSFSIYTNARIICSMEPMSSKEMLFLHGIRAFSIIWIVVSHVYNIGVFLTPATNSTTILAEFQNMLVMILLSGYFGVSSFFLLSSLLLSLSVFRELDRTKKLDLPVLYLKRYLRITIPLAALVVFTLGMLANASSGPIWNNIVGFHIKNCEDWWWTTLLYISNHINPGHYCVFHSWFLAVDFQLYFVSPLILYLLWRLRKRAAIVVPVILLLASTSIIFIFCCYMKYRFRVSHIAPNNYLKDVIVYSTTYGRIDSWMIGVLVAYIMHRSEGKTVTVSNKMKLLGWSLTTAVVATAVFGQYPLHQENSSENPMIADAIYESLKGFFWSLALGWTILACHFSFGGVVKQFFSLPIWLPISKLSFCVYLIHIPVQLFYTASLRHPVYFSHYRTFFLIFGNLGVTFFIAMAWALTFEFPILTILSVLIAKRKENKNTRA